MNYNISNAELEEILKNDSKLTLPLSKKILELGAKIIDPFPDNYIPMVPNDAFICGLFHKILFLFSEIIEAYEHNKLGRISIDVRVIYEAYINMRYLINATEDEVKLCRANSYINNKKIFNNENLDNDITDVLNYRFLQELQYDDLTLDDVNNSRNGTPNFKDKMSKFDNEHLYVPLYGLNSDAIHSDWHEIRQFYLKFSPEDKEYVVDTFNFPNPPYKYRLLIGVNHIILDAIKYYSIWFHNKTEISIKDVISYHRKLELMTKRVCEFILEMYKKKPDALL